MRLRLRSSELRRSILQPKMAYTSRAAILVTPEITLSDGVVAMMPVEVPMTFTMSPSCMCELRASQH